MSTQRVVVCAAMRKANLIFCGARHYDSVMRTQIDAANCDSRNMEQGFIDQYGVFMGRKEAWKVADMAGQIRRPTGNETQFEPRPANIGDDGLLFSENLY